VKKADLSNKPNMPKTTKIYGLIFSVIYLTAFGVAVLVYQLRPTDILTGLLIVGVFFSFLAWALTRHLEPETTAKPDQKKEPLILLALLLWVTSYITIGGDFITKLLPESFQKNEQSLFFFIIVRKLFVFFIIPFFTYRLFDFSQYDFGLKFSASKIFTKKNIYLLVGMSTAILLFQYFFSSGAKPLREGQFPVSKLIFAIPIAFIWLAIEAGLVEEFFFRGVLQARLAVLLKSEWGALLIGGLIFGLVHVPGLSLRGGESENIGEPLSVWFWISYCILNMSLAGVFLGIIWNKSRNLYLVIFLHAMVDLLPNLPEFIRIWKI
jgi:membrane protease YdiL (CAAX protease family)